MTKFVENVQKVMETPVFANRKVDMFSIFKAIIIACALVHLTFLFCFSLLGISELIIFNVFSVILYIILGILLHKKIYATVALSAFIEVGIHTALATVLLGWEYGFALELIALTPLAFYCPFKSKYTGYIYSGLSAVLFFYLRIYTYSNPPIITREVLPVVSQFLYIYNCVITIVVLVIFSNVYNYVIRSSQKELFKFNQSLMQLANIDPLTGLLNRRSMITKLDNAFVKREETGLPFALIIADIDDFKRVNDTFGHDCGDYVLKTLCKALRASIRENDDICRWGGEEILVLLNNTLPENANKVAENLRMVIQNTPLEYNGRPIKITMTFGISSEDSTINEMVLNADRNLYIGKGKGKNCVVK